ncbi:AMP-binding protein [Actinophytocola sp.]|uniref:AMP-binding protein n=1 Tax=Actinophytocola sp. TaxID=1872138 RepID=UPI00389A22BD
MVDALTGNVADLVADAAGRAPDRIALVDAASGRASTWAQTNRAVDAYAARLVDAGLEPGDRVVIALPNGSAFCVALYAVLRAGGIAVPAAATSPELPGLIEDSGAELVVGDTIDAPDLAVAGEPPGAITPAARGGEDIAVLCYTSGTAGVPRGVMLSHRALLSNVRQCAQLKPPPVTASDRVLLVVPLFHAYGLGPGLLQVTAAAATAVLMETFGTERALTVCAEHQVTTLVGVPAMYQALTTADPQRLAEGLASVRLLTSGAAPLSPAVLSAVKQATGLPVFEGYGLTETGPVLTSTLVSGIAKPGSVGRPLPDVELRIVDDDGVGADPDEEGWFDEDQPETGRVAARGPNLFSGYWPDGAGGPDAEGWFRTGDVGYLDADGDLRLVDRANDLIIVNGFNVYPNEVERVIDELPDVVESAAVGVPDERTGEQVAAVVVLRAGATLTEDEVREHCAERLARFKVPRTVRFADELPHSPTGKVRRAALRDGAAE